ncbi:MAG: hypothetical protein Q9190_000386 [Brigantiaea leucoxantha]
MTGRTAFLVIFFIIGIIAHPLPETNFNERTAAVTSRLFSTLDDKDPSFGSSDLINPDQNNLQTTSRLQEPGSKLQPRSTVFESPSTLNTTETIFYRVPGTRTALKIVTRPRILSGTNLHISLTNARNYVLTAIHRQRGNDPISRGTFIYPPNITGIGLIFVSFRQRLTWNEVDMALIGLLAALWGSGTYTEAKFTVFKWHDERDLEEEGSGTIYTIKRG